jgi:hypothetical protein
MDAKRYSLEQAETDFYALLQQAVVNAAGMAALKQVTLGHLARLTGRPVEELETEWRKAMDQELEKGLGELDKVHSGWASKLDPRPELEIQ